MQGAKGLELLAHEGQEVHNAVAVAKLVVVPGNELDKVVVEGNACAGIEDGGSGAADKVAGHNLVLSVQQNTLHGAWQHQSQGHKCELVGSVRV